MKYEVIQKCQNQFKISRLCSALQVSRSGYYGWLKQEPSQRAQHNAQFIEAIKGIDESSYHSYGTERMKYALEKQGIHIGLRRVRKLMQQAGCKNKQKRAWHPCTTQSNPCHAIVGMAIADHLQMSLVKTAFEMAWYQENAQQVTLFHSDQVAQYAASVYQNLLEGKVTQISMSRKGNCWDNAPMESFFGTLKTECVVAPFDSHQEAKTEIFHYIFGFYNNTRLHSSLDFMSPVDFEHNFGRQFFAMGSEQPFR